MDLRQAITNQIIAMLEQGGNVFRERWTRAASRGLPRNGKTGAPYHGANVLLLWDASIERGYASNVWLTYKQAAALGAQVRRGEKAVLCAHFERKVRGDRGDDAHGGEGRDSEEDDVARGGVLLCLPFWLFNVAQIDGLPDGLMTAPSPTNGGLPPSGESMPVVAAMRFIAACGADVHHGFDRAAYAPSVDRILMPDVVRFTSPEAYCATVLHELVHWTGHAKRLHREFGRRFGDAAYAFEELVAELGCAFVLGHIGLVDATIEGHASYLDSWLHVLRQDRTAIFTAARLAGEAYEFIVSQQVLADVERTGPAGQPDT
ncbi:MAG: DUF1738 domain-containing protein [Comamonadaceae bacterium]|nr:MAG: DUF1738 domain-containing protein [Comamonadaceae bacterium]